MFPEFRSGRIAAPPSTKPRFAAVSIALLLGISVAGCAGTRVEPKESRPDQPTDPERIQSLEAENRRLTDKLATVTAERDSFRAGREPAPCPSSDSSASTAAGLPPSASPQAPAGKGPTPAPASAAPTDAPPRVAIVVDGEEPGRVIEVRDEDGPAPPAAPRTPKSSTSSKKSGTK